MSHNVSTSIHKLDGDRPNHHFFHKVFYYIFNILNNKLPLTPVDPKIKQIYFSCNWEKNWAASSTKSSPSRKLSDIFWLSVPWTKIQAELPKVDILDIGCGSGNYSQRIMPHLNDDTTYTGADVYQNKNWAIIQSPKIKFQMFKGDTIDPFLKPELNLIISQSAFEHVEGDLAYFRSIAKFAEAKSDPTIQIHLLPTPDCLWLYGLHGFRQYNLRNVSRITRLFSNFSDCYLFQLGGDKCIQVHKEFIRIPQRKDGSDLRNTKTEEYDQALLKAVKEDENDGGLNPAYYALVIHSKPKNKIF